MIPACARAARGTAPDSVTAASAPRSEPRVFFAAVDRPARLASLAPRQQQPAMGAAHELLAAPGGPRRAFVASSSAQRAFDEPNAGEHQHDQDEELPHA